MGVIACCYVWLALTGLFQVLGLIACRYVWLALTGSAKGSPLIHE